jgi:ATP-dependent exoDNAse (exonuclease V) beta subunit
VNETFQKHYPDFVPSLSVKGGGCVQVTTGEPLSLIVENLFSLREKGVSDDEMAILCYTNDDVLRIEKVLKEADPTLHTVTETSSKLINHPKIRPLIAWLEYALNPSELGRGNFLSMIGHEYDEVIETDTLKSFNPLNVAMSLKGVIDHYGLFDGDENTIRFVEMGYKAKSVEDFLENLKTYDDAVVSGSLSGVRILTIHKSKGLEFEHVMVCDLLSKQNAQHDTLFFVPYDEVHEELRAYFGKRQNVDPVFQKVCDESDKLSKEDKLNGLYVAFTRGKESLFVAKREAQSAFEMLSLSDGIQGEIPRREKTLQEVVKKEKVFYYQPLSLGRQEDILGFDEEAQEWDYQAIAWGEAIHYALELATPFVKKEVILQSVHSRFGWIIGEKKGVISGIIDHYINDPFVSSLYEGDVHKEQPIVSDGKVFVIDFYSVFDDRVVVLDYKTGGKKEEYRTQIANYMGMLKNIYHRPVEGWICYVKNKEIELQCVV